MEILTQAPVLAALIAAGLFAAVLIFASVEDALKN